MDTLWTEVHTAWIGCYVYFTAVWTRRNYEYDITCFNDTPV